MAHTAKVDLEIPKKVRGKSFKQQELEWVKEKGEAALLSHGYKKGKVTHGWYGKEDSSTQDQSDMNHFDILPDGGNYIHVYEDGTSKVL